MLLVGGCSASTGSSEPAKSKPQAKQQLAGAPRIACTKPTFDYGKVAQGATVKHVFVLKNEGGAPLTIERAAGG